MNHQPKLLLCVEDDKDDIAMIEEAVLEIYPCVVFVAKENGKEALLFLNGQKQQSYLPCIILLDMNMPVMTGKELLEELKKDPKLKDIPVIVFTTSWGEREKLLCEAHNVKMITKPDKYTEFKKTIEHSISQCLEIHCSGN